MSLCYLTALEPATQKMLGSNDSLLNRNHYSIVRITIGTCILVSWLACMLACLLVRSLARSSLSYTSMLLGC